MVRFDFYFISRFWSTRVTPSDQTETQYPDSKLYTDVGDINAMDEGLSPESMPYINFYNQGPLLPGEGLGVIAAVG